MKVSLSKSLLCSTIISSVLTACMLSLPTFAEPTAVASSTPIQIMQLVEGERSQRLYVDGLSSLLRTITTQTTARMHPEPIIIQSLDDPLLFKNALLYINFDDRNDWTLSASEEKGLKDFIERGGFLYIDAGVKSAFLRNNQGSGHSFPDWKVRPKVKEIFEKIFPQQHFKPLDRNHAIFRIFQRGLPDAAELPEAIRDFVINEKWPQGTYSLLGLSLNNRLAVVASPIVAMGWGKDESDRWITPIAFRIREGSDHLNERLSMAAYSGEKFEVKRADGLVDYIYSQKDSKPTWIEEANGQWRIFRYYPGKEISDYAHQFYTQLGMNIFLYALLH